MAEVITDSSHRPVVVVGGGFAAMYAALAAKRVLGAGPEVVLVARSPEITIRPRLYEAAPENHRADLAGTLRTAGVRFLVGEICNVDLDRREVGAIGGRLIGYSRLILATGSRMRKPAIPGVEHAHSIDTLDEARLFDQRLSAVARQERGSVAVVGAGFTGIELVLELPTRIKAFAGQHGGEKIDLFLIDSADVVGPELGPGPRPYILDALRAARINVLLSATVRELGPDFVELSSGRRVPVDLIALCTGLVAAETSLLRGVERDSLGRVMVDENLRPFGLPEIFVAGDAAVALADETHQTLMSCQHAMWTGRIAGENAARDLLAQPLRPYRQPSYITCLDMGPTNAIVTSGWDRRPTMFGTKAKLLKERINREIIYPPAGSRAEILRASIVAGERA